MNGGRSAHTVSVAFWTFLILSFPKAHGEPLFRWTDDAGRPCYSNVSPAAGVKTYSVDTVSYTASVRSSPARAFTDTDTVEKMPAETDGPYPDFSAAFLERRITDRKTSIGHIEALLRKHPNDPVLRKRLFQKKRYLFEDLTRLESIQR